MLSRELRREVTRHPPFVENPVRRQILSLVKQGVPWDVACEMDDDERTACLIICGELEGEKWDWGEMRWIKQSKNR